MAEEPQPMSIQQRIAALNKVHIGQGLNGSRPTFRLQPASHLSSQPAALERGELPDDQGKVVVHHPNFPPPPQPSTAASASNGTNLRVPPPLPARKLSTSSAPPPALPPRIPSGRRNSRESLASDTSLSTTTTTTSASAGTRTPGTSSTTPDACLHPVRAPPWNAKDPVPLPPKREQTKAVIDSWSSSKPKLPSPFLKTKTMPARPAQPTRTVSSNNNVRGNGHLASQSSPQIPRNLPPRPSLPSRSSSSNNDAASSPAAVQPPLTDDTTKPQSAAYEARTKLPIKKPPPPPVSVETLRRTGLTAMWKSFDTPDESAVSAHNNSNSPEAVKPPEDVPPPVPLASRPDLSKILATKPRLQSSSSSNAGSTVACLKCRDYSAPDAHAARFPRESLPTYDLRWLANELTTPFPSLTDKARVIFTWLHHNVSYDVYSFFNNCVKPSTPANTLATGLAVCEGYAGLFTALATHAGMESLVVSGHGKGFGFQDLAPGSALPPFKASHAWNVVRIDNGQWKLIDPCWGAGHVQGAGQPYVKEFNPAMFTDTNDEFGLRHFPSNKNQFYRDDGRSEISWEEYLLPPTHPMIYSDAKRYHIGRRTFQPATNRISVHQPGPIRFQFSLICPHWTLEHHSKNAAGFFLLNIHGIDGRRDEHIPFNHVRGSGPGGGGDVWYVDIADPRVLGAPGQSVQVMVLTSFGDRKDPRGLTPQEYREKTGRVGMAWAGIAQWELI
ncbi:hypothetical protein MPDQ_002137 [Monascus purpureus]|uniref:Transglutaminase-like domain-containing protein n=1 Tax=Monascus purpureus TaxID=5098 RepID=A0A507QN07_MONPU|nr:hypothetical protein MPDQ_002137 [Monascus purpureus]BDD62225.1 hypothetical protein MAP00_007204 [Monascus purpureus]